MAALHVTDALYCAHARSSVAAAYFVSLPVSRVAVTKPASTVPVSMVPELSTLPIVSSNGVESALQLAASDVVNTRFVSLAAELQPVGKPLTVIAATSSDVK